MAGEKSYRSLEPGSSWTFQDSRFWERVKHDSLLASKIGMLTSQAAAISGRVCEIFPLYTAHDSTHFRNVLYFMDRLVTDEGLDALGTLGCALCILAAYLHDLGMAPSRQTLDQIDDQRSELHGEVEKSAFKYHGEQASLWRSLREGNHQERQRARDLWNYFRADYIRRGHASLGDSGVFESQLDFLEKTNQEFSTLFSYHGIDFRSDIAKICASHNQSTEWLIGNVDGKKDDGNQENNLILAGLLLRLADICDFDSTRTPRILFHHLALDGEQFLGIGAAHSKTEWKKHLAVNRWVIADRELKYVSATCPHPAVAKAIRDFVNEINRELTDVREQLAKLNGENWLQLPSRAIAKITPQKTNGKEDWLDIEADFTLQPDAVFKLLMGTSLYADPSLCIRELLQNALDAVELRDLRAKLTVKLSAEGKASVCPERSEEWTTEEKAGPKIILQWGTDAKGKFISVEDLGIGMTRRQVTEYFARVGQSYYRSPEQQAERQLLRENGLIYSPISQFGIGFLSCFMLADRVEVSTRPCVADHERCMPLDFTVTGPGTVFHFRKGTRLRPGSKITLRLKPNVSFQDWTQEQAMAVLRDHFGYPLDAGQKHFVDQDNEERKERHTASDYEGKGKITLHPGVEAAEQLIWPKYDVAIQGPRDQIPWHIDQGIELHFGKLLPFDQAGLRETAEKWECSKEQLGEWHWAAWDWQDGHALGTGSRIRLVLPVPKSINSSEKLEDIFPSEEICRRIIDGAGLVERRMRRNRSRTRYLVHAMRVSHMDECAPEYLLFNGVGAFLWVDWRGAAAPQLTAARDQAFPPADSGRWHDQVMKVFSAWSRMVGVHVEASVAVQWTTTQESSIAISESKSPPGQWNYLRWMRPFWKSKSWERPWACEQLLADSALGRGRALALDRDLAISFDLDLALDLARDFAREVARDLDLDLASAIARKLDLALPWATAVLHNLANEFFFPSWSSSFVLAGLRGIDANSPEVTQLAPAILNFNDQGPASNTSIRDYDFVFPFSAFPGPRLSRIAKEKQWRQIRGILVTPFFFHLNEKGLKSFSQYARTVSVKEIHVLFPRFDLWEKPFTEWNAEDHAYAGYSACWDAAANRVRWALGVVSPMEMAQKGKPIEEFLESQELRGFREKFPKQFEYPDWMGDQAPLPPWVLRLARIP